MHAAVLCCKARTVGDKILFLSTSTMRSKLSHIGGMPGDRNPVEIRNQGFWVYYRIYCSLWNHWLHNVIYTGYLYDFSGNWIH